ncbi:MAG: phage tail protein [Clostridia bacterium]|nr:phage tail protein [Clostridia bacterium]
MGGIKLTELDFLHLLPAFMRDDEAAIAISKAMNKLMGEPMKRIDTIRTWDQIDNLNEPECDEMAWELDIDWYDSDGMTLDEKRETIKMAQQIKRKRGTKWAVERLISVHFGEGYVAEWYDIGTPPYTFAVLTTNPAITAEAYEKFLEAAKIAKNERSHIAGVYYYWQQGPEPGIEYAPSDKRYIYEFEDCGTSCGPDGEQYATVGMILRDAIAFEPTDAPYVYNFPRYGSYGMNSVVGTAIVGTSVVGGSEYVEGEGKCGTYPRDIMTGGTTLLMAATEPKVEIMLYGLPQCGSEQYKAVVGTAIVGKSIVTY